LERNQIRTANRQRTCFDMRPCYYFFNQVTQFSIIAVVSALNVEWATDCDRSFTLPVGKTGEIGITVFALLSLCICYILSRSSAE
jgi:hypothetical protein